MKVGKVTGSVWATRKAACLQGQTFLVVKSEGEEIVAADQVGAGPGDRVLLALAEGKSVYLYTPGLPSAPKNRALAGSLTAAQRELKNWGVLFTDGGRKKLITAEEARILRQKGQLPGPGAVLTPLAKEIMEGM